MGFLNEAVMDEDVGPESLREGRDDDKGATGMTKPGREARRTKEWVVYGFRRGE